jgi:hypothetical protein
MPQQEFLERMDAQRDQIKQGERLPGVQKLLLPGERGQRRYLDLTARGVVALAAPQRLAFSTCLVGAVRFDKVLNRLQVVRKGRGSPLCCSAVAVGKVDPYVKRHESAIREAMSAYLQGDPS